LSPTQGRRRPDDSGDGLSIATAKKTIGAALAPMKILDGTEHVILVAAGSYTGTSNKNLSFDVYDIKLRSIDGAETTIIDLENSGRFINGIMGSGPEAILEGFTIRNGNSGSGGAIDVYSSNPLIINCVFESNVSSGYGGAVQIGQSSGTALFENCEFRGNRALTSAGAVSVWSGSDVVFRNCRFEDNQISGGFAGGAAFARVSKVTFEECEFLGNHADAAAGGAVGMLNNSHILLFRCILSGNTAKRGGAIYVSVDSRLSLENSLVSNNRAPALCGGILFETSLTGNIIRSSTIAFNKSDNSSGEGICVNAGTPEIDILN
jgi:hypothetical protein